MNASTDHAAALDLMRRLPAEDRAARDSAITYLTSLSSPPPRARIVTLLSGLFAHEDAELLWQAWGFPAPCKIKAAPAIRRRKIDPREGLSLLGLR